MTDSRIAEIKAMHRLELWEDARSDVIDELLDEVRRLRAEVEHLTIGEWSTLRQVTQPLEDAEAEIAELRAALETVCDAVHDYLLDCAYGGASPIDLRNALEQVAHLRKEKADGNG